MDPIFVSCPLGGLVAEFDDYVLLAKGWPSHGVHDIIIDRVRRGADMQRLWEEYAGAREAFDASHPRTRYAHAAAMEMRGVKRGMQGLYTKAIHRHVAATARFMPMAEYRALLREHWAEQNRLAAAAREEFRLARIEEERKNAEWRRVCAALARGEHVPDTTPAW